MPTATPSRPPAGSAGPGARGLVCPSCGGDSFAQRSSFMTASEPVLGAASTVVTVDLMSCKRCGVDLPAVRGRRNYTLMTDKKLASLLSDLEDAQRANSEMERLLDTLARRSQAIRAETERVRVGGETSVAMSKIDALRTEAASLEERKKKLATVVEVVSSMGRRR